MVKMIKLRMLGHRNSRKCNSTSTVVAGEGLEKVVRCDFDTEGRGKDSGQTHPKIRHRWYLRFI